MNIHYLLISILFLSLTRCASPRVGFETAMTNVPAGIDGSFAAMADSIYSVFFISGENEQQASESFARAERSWSIGDSLWKIIHKEGMAVEDSLTISRLTNEYLKMHPTDFKGQSALTVSRQLMRGAIHDAESAIQRDRLNITYPVRLSQYLHDFASVTADRSFLVRSAEILENLVVAQRGYPHLFYQLGKIYFELGEWEKAFISFERSKSVLRATAFFDHPDPLLYYSHPEKTPVDTVFMKNCTYFQVQCKMKMYDDHSSLLLLNELMEYAKSPDEQHMFQKMIDWILWDGGNIIASESKDRIDSKKISGKFRDVKNEYVDLLKKLRTKKARDDVEWNIGFIEYSMLGQKIKGFRRIHEIIRKVERDSATGAPIDTSCQKYFETYGIMCYNFGIENLKSDVKKAYVYFRQAAATPYRDRGRAFLQLADLSQFNPEETIAWCKMAEADSRIFSIEEKRLLYQLYHRSYRKRGDFALARQWYDCWKGL